MTSDDLNPDDPFVDSSDPAAREREERRREREEKRRKKAEKKAPREAPAPAPPPQQTPTPQPPPAPPAAPPPAQPASATPTPEPNPPAPPPPPAPTPPPRRRTPLPADPEPLTGAPRGTEGEGPIDDNFWGEPQPEKERRRRRPGTRGGKLRRPLAILAVLVAIGALFFLNALFQPLHGDGSGRVAVVIPKGASVSDVGDLLDERGVVSNSRLFQIRVSLAGKRSELFPGRYVLANDMSYGSAIDAISTAPVTKTLTITIPEGLSRPQTAELLADAGVSGDYEAASANPAQFDPSRFGAQGRAKNLEGFLFPATYELPAKGTAKQLVQRQLDAFEDNIAGVDLAYAKKKNLTVYDVVTIASMIEDEAIPADFRNVASVIYNRLREDIPLGLDATTRFAVGNYDEPLTVSQLESDSPYNTRVVQGLPPGPIASPGLAALKAAANPTRTDFIYYVTDPDSCNRLAFSETDADFQRDSDRYDAARDANGGNAPSTC